MSQFSDNLDYRRILAEMPARFLILRPDPHFTILDASDAYLRATSTERAAIVGRGLVDVISEGPSDAAAASAADLRASLARVLASRRSDALPLQKYAIRRARREGGGAEAHTWSAVNTPVLDGRGEIQCIVHRIEDVTELARAQNALSLQTQETALARARAHAEEALAARGRLLETLNHAAISLGGEHDLEKIGQRVTDAATAVSGAAFGVFFYRVTNDAGESRTRSALSGVSREEFTALASLQDVGLFAPTSKGKSIARIADLRRDPRWEEYVLSHGIPEGQPPVASYLAVPVRSRSGRVLGGLFFGHPAPDVFTAETENTVAALAAQAAIAIDNTELYRDLQRELARAQEGDVSSRWLAAIVESSEDAIISKDLTGTITSWNRGAEQLFGYTAPEIVGKPVLVLIPPDRREEEPFILARLRRGERVEHFETVRQHKDGHLIEISLTISPIHDRTGKVVGASKIARDITARRRAETRQRAITEMLVRINRARTVAETHEAAMGAILGCLSANRAAVLIADEEGRMRFVAWRGLSDEYRAAMEAFSPWRTEELDPQPVIASAIPSAALPDDMNAAVAREGVRSIAFLPLIVGKRLKGRLMVYFDVPHAFSSDDINVAEAIAAQIAFAIERHHSATALETLVSERTRSLQQAIAQMEEFSYSVSHDLRAPVRAMRGYAEVVLQDYGTQLGEEGRDLLGRIQRSGERMDRLIQDLLTYTRLSRRPMKFEAVSPLKLIHEVIQQYPEMKPDRATIDLPEALPEVMAHEPSLTQVVSNLLSNAVKFVPSGTKPHVAIRCERRGDRAVISFQDNGIGIPAEHHARLFGMFERFHPDHPIEGTGIGLAIVRKAMERMHGKVGMTSNGGGGSRFWIELPLAHP